MTKPDGSRAVAYCGLRKIDPVDALLLNWRLKLKLPAGQPLKNPQLLRKEIRATAVRFPLRVLYSQRFQDRLAFYGFEAAQKPFERMRDELRDQTGPPLELCIPAHCMAPPKEQTRLRWIPAPL
jgi:hypothetical protein